jgi:adenylate kinase
MQLILFGSPGVGKGTQAKILSNILDIPHISTGDILRKAVKDKTPIGVKVQEIMGKGGLVPDAIMAEIIKDTLHLKCKNGFILDGYPRTLAQAHAFDELLIDLSIKELYVIAITADTEEIVKRLTSRRACKVCGQIFNYSDIKGLMTCPNCGAEKSFYQRNDDKEEVIKHRLEVYNTATKPVLKYYKEQDKVIYINGARSVKEVSENILSALKAKSKKDIPISV